MDEGGRDEGGDGTVVAEEFTDRGVLDVFVVVGGEAKFHLAGRKACIFAGVSGEEGADRNGAVDGAGAHLRLLLRAVVALAGVLALALVVVALRTLAAAEVDGLLDSDGLTGEHATEGAEPTPGIVQVETGLEVVLALAFGEHQEVVAGAAELGDAVFPEFEGHIVGRIAAEAVDADLYDPELHGVNHSLAEFRIVEVQVSDIVPAGTGRADDFAGIIVGVPLRVVLDPLVVPGGMVGDPVDDDGHAALVGTVYEGLEILEGTEFRVDGSIILDAIGTLYGFLDTEFANRHEPYDVGSEVLDGVQTGADGLEGILRREVARVDLVHHDIFRSRNRDVAVPARARDGQKTNNRENESFHNIAFEFVMQARP